MFLLSGWFIGLVGNMGKTFGYKNCFSGITMCSNSEDYKDKIYKLFIMRKCLEA